MEHAADIIPSKTKVTRRKSDFVLGRRKSRGRSSCFNRFETRCEDLSPEEQLKHQILKSVKAAAHHVSEDLSRLKDAQYLEVLVAVEESCTAIEQRLDTPGTLAKALHCEGAQTEDKDSKGDLARYEEYFKRLSEESCNWDAALNSERKALSSFQKSLDRVNVVAQVPYSSRTNMNYNDLLSTMGNQKSQINKSLRDLTACFKRNDLILSQAALCIHDKEEKIRNEFQEFVNGTSILDILRSLSPDNLD